VKQAILKATAKQVTLKAPAVKRLVLKAPPTTQVQWDKPVLKAMPVLIPANSFVFKCACGAAYRVLNGRVAHWCRKCDKVNYGEVD